MKQPIDWIQEKCPNPPRSGTDELKTMLEIIQAIQLDAWKQGMTDAAEIVDSCRGEEGDLRCVRDLIITRSSQSEGKT